MKAAARNVWRIGRKSWMAFARALGWMNTRVLLTLVYVALGVPAVALRLFGKDALGRKWNTRSSAWSEKRKQSHSIDQARRQF